MKTIVAVENDAESLNALTSQLRAACPDGQVVGFLGPERVPAYCERHAIGAVFSEILMRGMSGFGLAERLRKRDPELFIVFVTDRTDLALDAFQARANGYLVKPLDPDDLRAKLDQARHFCA